MRNKKFCYNTVVGRTIKMASFTCASRSLFVKVAPVSGQVKYTPDTEQQVAPLASKSAPFKKNKDIY